MATSNKIPILTIVLVGIGLIVTIFGIRYIRANPGDRGTSQDDSPAAAAPHTR
ncbi:hypothetical protein [Nannocystis punicea]|uniref:Uncharacterized protein n=1 Tax=Nannocystis punicea TaxID=2995304 RepID=A0ABY7GUY8_9BACT|nr:hypothetical protein [Nannocystis poenicansa]WAS90710.1 hypothetical protein O0S08_31370 [Nannocystis poenicansa]